MKFRIENVNKFQENFYLEQYLKLNKYQKRKINKLVHREDKRLSILGMYLISDTLSIDISQIFYNKRVPYVKQNKFISISHKYPYVSVVVSDIPIGIDLEINRKVDEMVINYLNSKSSKEALLRWTRMESLFKCQKKHKVSFKTIIINNELILTLCC